MDSSFQAFVAGENSNSPTTELPYDEEESASDCESGITDSSSGNPRIFAGSTVVAIPKNDRSYELIRRIFVAGVGETAVVTAVHRTKWSEKPSRIQTFRIHAKAMERKCGGNPNMKFGWYHGDKENIENILAHGFSYRDLQVNNGVIALSVAPSVEDWGEGESGLRHVILCQVLLGRSELVEFGSGQVHPSSDEFDSGVDSYDNPKKYVIWSTNMNAHILPEYVVTFKVRSANSSAKEVVSKMKIGVRMPTSPWISFPALISILSKFLAREATSLIIKYHKFYKERRLSRGDLIQKVRQIAGDKLLIAVLKSFKGAKEYRVSFGLSHYKNYINN